MSTLTFTCWVEQCSRFFFEKTLFLYFVFGVWQKELYFSIAIVSVGSLILQKLGVQKNKFRKKNFFPLTFFLFINFDFERKKLWITDSTAFVELSKLYSTCPGEQSEVELFIKMVTNVVVFGIWNRKKRKLGVKLSTELSKLYCSCRRKYIALWKKKVINRQVWTLKQKLVWILGKKLAGLSKRHSSCPEEYGKYFFLQKL